MSKKTTHKNAAVPSASYARAQRIGGAQEKSGLGKLLDSLPAPFISLNGVIEAIAEAKDGSLREAARSLRILLETEADFPQWYRWTDAKSKGKLDPEHGTNWGPKLIQHVAMTGEPAEFPHDGYRECGYDLSTMPAWSAHHFLFYGPTLGFQRSEIGPFLTAHGLNCVETHDPANDIAVSDEDAFAAATGVNPEAELPWWQNSPHDILDMAQSIGERLKAAGLKPSNTKIAKEIASRISAIEQSKARDRTIGWERVRKALNGWRLKAAAD